jgi:nitrite reductase/ring-hydroxylating ferredoxin subunit
MRMMLKVAKSKEVKERVGTGKQVNGLNIALFRHDGRVFALQNSCPHQGAPIHLGFVRDGCVVCPHHGWSFRLDTGEFTHNNLVKIKTYPAREEDGYIFIET